MDKNGGEIKAIISDCTTGNTTEEDLFTRVDGRHVVS